MLRDLPTWTGGTLKVANTPVELSRTPGGAERGAPKPGADTVDFLRKAGVDQTKIEALIGAGFAATGPEAPCVLEG